MDAADSYMQQLYFKGIVNLFSCDSYKIYFYTLTFMKTSLLIC